LFQSEIVGAKKLKSANLKFSILYNLRRDWSLSLRYRHKTLKYLVLGEIDYWKGYYIIYYFLYE
jgi:hypothetical protein